MDPGPGNTIEVDARGLRCPLPVIRLGEAARDAPAGARIVVLATDPAARHDIPAWCRMRGHELREVTDVDEVTDVREVSEVTEMSQVSDSSRTTGDSAEQVPQPAYLRFLVLIRPADPARPVSGVESRRKRQRE